MERHLAFARFLTRLLDKQFKIGNFSFGIDPLLGFIPGIGDFIALLLSGYLVWIGLRMNVPEDQIAKMVRNIMVDFVLGLIPFLGDISDLIYKANSKNLSILESHYKERVIDGEVIESEAA